MLADAGYKCEEELRRLRARGTRPSDARVGWVPADGYVSVGREDKNAAKIVSDLPETRAMKHKLGTKRGRATYKKRKHLVEPVFGWIKAVLGFRQFSLRGAESVNAEWELICSATNLRRMAGRLRWA